MNQPSTTANGTFSSTLGSEVRSRRISLGLNQLDVADLAGVSERFIRFVEQGKPTIQLEPLLAVLGTLGLELTVRHAQSPAETQHAEPQAYNHPLP
ncbi:helix-turn-helix transcriptional regulator [Arthrobacter sp. M4]|uniref:helix-turn-helix transcriptional regulator n=1 Tax=Arthrobacter sp. M4 TaxID=218160 RepID=UPI001CDC60C3|nr:helix-turn-helix transcriptional regulator [Arthrobacter sp. M4]MCA4134911.1 helix-turn-helix transcriptional regulator [Arthrobacter sp. M4]